MLEASASYGFRNSISLVFFATQMQRKHLRCICVALLLRQHHFHQKTTNELQKGR